MVFSRVIHAMIVSRTTLVLRARRVHRVYKDHARMEVQVTALVIVRAWRGLVPSVTNAVQVSMGLNVRNVPTVVKVNVTMVCSEMAHVLVILGGVVKPVMPVVSDTSAPSAINVLSVVLTEYAMKEFLVMVNAPVRKDGLWVILLLCVIPVTNCITVRLVFLVSTVESTVPVGMVRLVMVYVSVTMDGLEQIVINAVLASMARHVTNVLPVSTVIAMRV